MQEKNIYFGVLIIGPSGSGKTTLCAGFQQIFNQLERSHLIINLDPATEYTKYDKADIDIKDLICIDDVMQELNLGPNGALLYCMQFLENNINWLINQINLHKNKYLIFDFPGQIELYMCSDHVKNIIQVLQNNQTFESQLTVLELFDSCFCYDYSSFISLSLHALSSLMNLEMPHINILSKIDLMKQNGKPPMSLEHYLEAKDLAGIYAFDCEEYKKSLSSFDKKCYKLNKAIAELFDEFGLISFYPLYINNKLLVSNLIYKIDKSNGFLFYPGYVFYQIKYFLIYVMFLKE
ncbi:hypothetical protein IMG5_165330 [Ichthyophthirius multifiliis]|uniref:GPN-loop GTPase 2 n=1 Tax=Ichthyophthirius multifiliis TaxID=5932 RepID=G0R0K3_ICHMU|nr:hypothetical protein IMG5_165330 [Ichthyophthirius multifiliis]EGR28989.1 hypothetical protein IMG5_165330 [Ichthyophthirius multifiliis]|eukprot:XP_004030225.1 hypothetical protein IMG5_165330 [Ichthyophthirius multifiliis]